MNIRECVGCGKAIYGNDYYSGSGGYYHKDCQADGAGSSSRVLINVDCEHLSVGNGGGWQEGTLTFSADGVSFTPAEYKIYILLKEIKSKLDGEG